MRSEDLIYREASLPSLARGNCITRQFLNFRTFAGDRIGKLIREAAINGLIDDTALEVGFGIGSSMRQSLFKLETSFYL